MWFRYSDDHPWVLSGVDLFVPVGRAVALVGRNGAGKSTLVKLPCRLYDPTRGAILWDGVDLRDRPSPTCGGGSGRCFRTSCATTSPRRRAPHSATSSSTRRSPRLQRARKYLEAALLCRYDHPATECRMMGEEIDRRLAQTVPDGG